MRDTANSPMAKRPLRDTATFLDWLTLGRPQAEILAPLAAGALSVDSFHDPHRNVVYAELAREAAA